jgi:hypothetical protein
MRLRYLLCAALSTGLTLLAPRGLSGQEALLCGSPQNPERERYVQQNLDRTDLRSVVESWEHQEGLSLSPSVRAAVLTEYLCEEHRQRQQRKKATDADIRAAGQRALVSYLAALREDKPRVETLGSLFAQNFGDAGWLFPKPRKFILLTVATQPPQAEVEVDELVLGPGKEILLLPGRHRVKASQSGFQLWQKDVDVEIGRNLRLQCNLLPSKP